MSALLVVSVSGLSGARLSDCSSLAASLDQRGVPLSLLLSPRYLASAPRLADWVRGRVACGDAALLRGVERLAGRPRPGWWPASGLAVLPAHETRLQLVAARAALARLDLPVRGYAPPGWLVPPGTLKVLRDNGFSVCVESRGVRDLGTGELVPGRVLGPGPAGWRGERAEPWWCRAMVLGADRRARSDRLVRVALPAAGLCRPGIRQAALDAVDIALHHGAEPATYVSVVPRGTRVTARSARRAVAR